MVSHRYTKMVSCDLLLISNGFKHFIRIWVVLGLGLRSENMTQSLLQASVGANSTLPESNRKDYRPFIFQNNVSFQSALQVQLSITAKCNHTEVCIIQNFWKTWFKLTDPNHTETYINCESRSACLFFTFDSSAFPSACKSFIGDVKKNDWQTTGLFRDFLKANLLFHLWIV